jgi:hypothetical protein
MSPSAANASLTPIGIIIDNTRIAKKMTLKRSFSYQSCI